MPLNGRNFTFLAQLGAGMQTPQADTRGNAASGAFSANGLRPAQNNYLLDGIDNNSNAVDFLNGTNYVILPPVDAIQEFKVQTADFSAELGRAAGAVLNATIKSGTNSIHGAAWEFFRNDKLDAADWFEDNSPASEKGELRQNQFGADDRRPDHQEQDLLLRRLRRLAPRAGHVVDRPGADALERSSGYTNLADILALQCRHGQNRHALGRAIQKGTILDPGTTRFVASGAVDPVSGLTNSFGQRTAMCAIRSARVCGPGTTTFTTSNCSDLNMLPASRIDANAVKLLNLYPAPNPALRSTYQDSPGLFEHSQSHSTRAKTSTRTRRTRSSPASATADDPHLHSGHLWRRADGGAFQQGDSDGEIRPDGGGLHPRLQPEHDQPGARRLCSPAHHPLRTGGHARWAFPRSTASRVSRRWQKNGGLPDFGIGNLANLGSNNFLPSDEVSADPPGHRRLHARSTASTASRWASSTST